MASFKIVKGTDGSFSIQSVNLTPKEARDIDLLLTECGATVTREVEEPKPLPVDEKVLMDFYGDMKDES